MTEQRVDGALRARERGRMGDRGPAARPGGARLDRENGLPPRQPACDAPELPGVAERLEIEKHELRARVVLPPLEQVVRGHVGLVADRDERGEAKASARGGLEEREAERTALGGETDRAGRERAARERRVQPSCRRRDAEAVGPDQTGTSCTHDPEEPLLPPRPLFTCLGEAGRDHADGPRARIEGLGHRPEHTVGRDTDHG